tara:strand:+ start:862 stop:1071 length:210 start_codon:yes stop_codon:yes gene_type:complete
MKQGKQLKKFKPLEISAASCSITDVIYYIKDSELSNHGFLFTNLKNAAPEVRDRLFAEAKTNAAIDICE